jgi:hypothetical protein
MGIEYIPTDSEAENVLVSTLYKYPDLINKYQDKIKTTDFYYSNYRIIYSALIDMNSKNIPIDIITLDEYARKHNLKINLIDNINDGVILDSFEFYLKRFVDASTKRKLINLFYKTLNEDSDINEILDNVSKLKNTNIGKKFDINDLSPLRFLNTDVPEVEWLIKDVLAKGICGFIYGEGGSFKSIAALSFVLQSAISSFFQTKWLDRFTIEPKTIINADSKKQAIPLRGIFISAEDVEIDLHLRIKTIIACLVNDLIDKRKDLTPGVIFDTIQNAIEQNCLVLSQEQWADDRELFIVDENGKETSKIDSIIHLIKEFNADFVILETLSRIANVDEIDNKQAARVVGALERIRNATGATILCIAHSSKISRMAQTDVHGQNGLRGAGALMDNSRFGIWFKAMQTDKEGNNQVEIINSKNFRCKRFEPFQVAVEFPRFKLVEKSKESKSDIFDEVVEYVKNNPGCKQREVIKEIGGSRSSISNAFKDAINEGLIELRGPKNKPDGYYYICEE